MSSRVIVSRYGNLRREIAALAARLMAEEGVRDYGFAKRKAAKQLGARDSDMLPNNAEIEAELRAWQALYQDEEQAERIRYMREAALGLMRRLEDFNPYLTGAVLDGTAGRYAEIEIDLFPDSTKDVEIFLLNQNLPYAHREVRRPSDGPESVLELEWDDCPVRLSVYERSSERQARRGSRHVERARTTQLAALIEGLEP